VSVGADGRFTPVPREDWLVVPLEDQFDAVLWLGPASEMTMRDVLTPAVCADEDYLTMRLERMALAGLPPPMADRLRDYCAGQPAQ
jgi:hypothetical protein